jgi:hypothetical protein
MPRQETRVTTRFDIEAFLEHQTHDTFTFPLHASSIGRKEAFKVTCRRLEVIDRASLSFLPDKLQNKVWTQLRTTQQEISRRQEAGQTPKDINEALANIEDQLKIADILCEYGWIEPKVTRDPAREDLATGVMWVGRFKAADRAAYMIACNDADSEQARLFRILRDEPADDVSDREGGEVVPDAPERPAGHPAAPIAFEPAVQR